MSEIQDTNNIGLTSDLGTLPFGLICLEDVEPEEIDWLWRGYLPFGKLVIIDGNPGQGKSAITLDIAARFTNGSPMPDRTPGPGFKGNVLVCSAEDGLGDTIRPRLDAAGAVVGRVFSFRLDSTPEGNPMFSIPEDLFRLSGAIRSRRIRLVIIDPFVAYLSASVRSSIDQEVRRALSPLSLLAEDTGCCILLVRHNRKAMADHATHQGGGSIGITGAARSALAVREDPDSPEQRLLYSVKANTGKRPDTLKYRLVGDSETSPPRVEWLGTSHYTAESLQGLTGQSSEPKTPYLSKVDKAALKVREILQEGPLRKSEVYARLLEAGHKVRPDGNENRRLIKSAGVLTVRVGSGSGSYSLWMLPEAIEGVAEDTGTQGQEDIRTIGQKPDSVVFRDSVSPQSSVSYADLSLSVVAH